MQKLSKKEWIAVAAGVIFVGYTLFGGSITTLFQKNVANENKNSTATVVNSFNNNGVIINDIVIGQGVEVKLGQLVRAHYVLSLQDGTVIQNSKDIGFPVEFTLGAGEVIPGWELGFSGVKVGGIRTIVVPPELAYGNNQAGPIPPNSTLIFTIEVIDAVDIPVQPTQ